MAEEAGEGVRSGVLVRGIGEAEIGGREGAMGKVKRKGVREEGDREGKGKPGQGGEGRGGACVSTLPIPNQATKTPY